MVFLKAHARDWNKFEVCEWIQSLSIKGPGSEKIADLFLTHEINGDVLFSDIDDEVLEELGISFLQRKKNHERIIGSHLFSRRKRKLDKK